MERMLDAAPKNTGYLTFVLSKDMYTNLCKELNRNVKSYKKHKVIVDIFMKNRNATLSNV